MKNDYQTREGRLQRKNKESVIKNIVFMALIIIGFVGIFLYAIKELADKGAEYQCARLEGQFKQFPEEFFITELESKMCPDLQAPVKTIIN